MPNQEQAGNEPIHIFARQIGLLLIQQAACRVRPQDLLILIGRRGCFHSLVGRNNNTGHMQIKTKIHENL